AAEPERRYGSGPDERCIVLRHGAHPGEEGERGDVQRRRTLTRGRSSSPAIRRDAGETHCAGCSCGASVVPPCRALCLYDRFIWRHSARVFSSPALHACFVARAPCRILRRSLRRSMPCVWADTGTVLSNIRPAANAAAALAREIRMSVLLF